MLLQNYREGVEGKMRRAKQKKKKKKQNEYKTIQNLKNILSPSSQRAICPISTWTQS